MTVLGPVAPVVLAVVIIFVSTIAMIGAYDTRRAASQVQAATQLDDLYRTARAAVAAESEAHLAYRIDPTQRIRADYNSAATELTAVLDEIAATGGAADRAMAARIGALHREYLREDARLFQAIDAQDPRALARFDSERVEATFGDVRAAVDVAADAHRDAVNTRIAQLKDRTRFVGTTVPIAGGIGMLLVVIFAVLMVTYRRQMRAAADREIARLEEAAFVDNLTGLGNHRALHEQLVAFVDEAAEQRQPLAVIALDLDGLKDVNDTKGHKEGDRLIRRLSRGLRGVLPAGAKAYRVGGDEFIAVLPNHTSVDAFHLTQELQTQLAPPSIGIRAPNITMGHETGATHVTVGICDLAASGGDAELALHRADIALIEAKRMLHRGLIWSAGIERVHDADGSAEADHRRRLATSLAKAVDAKDSYTRSHCETVAQLCVLIGEQLMLDPAAIEQLRLAGLLHDVGKIGVPDAILNKPDRLTDAEYLEMQGHSTLGQSIIAAAQLTDQALWVRHHHERIDGTGYPDRLVGDDIPLQSRIIFVADAFEAITSDRPYRAGSPAEAALIELRRCAGTQFDPHCVAALEQALAISGIDAIVPASATAKPRVIEVPGSVDVPDEVIRRAA